MIRELTMSKIANKRSRWWKIRCTFCLEKMTMEKLLPKIPIKKATKIKTPSTIHVNKSSASSSASENTFCKIEACFWAKHVGNSSFIVAASVFEVPLRFNCKTLCFDTLDVWNGKCWNYLSKTYINLSVGTMKYEIIYFCY